MKSIALDGRLLSVAGFVRQDAVLADIGTDHAHLPVFLLKAGKIKRAVCSDINAGPLAVARANAACAGVADRIDFELTDGLIGLEKYPVTDYAVCGMGGELIAEIITKDKMLCRSGVRLILQPMTKPECVRWALGKIGFRILHEAFSHEGGKYYVCIVAEYDGIVREISEIEAVLGEKQADFDNLSSQIEYFCVKKRAQERKVTGKAEGGKDKENDALILDAINERLEYLDSKRRETTIHQ